MKNWIEIFEFPLSAILAAAFVTGLLSFYAGFKESRLCKALGGRFFTVATTVLAIVFLAVNGTWAIEIKHNPFFLILVLFIMTALGLTVLDAIRKKVNLSFILCHLGLFIILFGGFFGAPDFKEGNMKVTDSYESCIAVSTEGEHFVIPFKIRLEEFRTDYYEDGISPKQYSSTLYIDGDNYSTSVNKPCHYKGYLIYQSGFEGSDCSILKVVHDPWLPLVLFGILISVVGAVLSVSKLWKSWLTIVITICLAIVFTLISLAGINLGTLAPALRSFWFLPHLAAYMLAYSLLAISLILKFLRKDRFDVLARQLVGTASALLLVGMLCGAVWAKFAWGDYWTWDPKECWAAATWLLTLIATHLPQNRKKLVLAATIIAFLAMQITWYGVNYLPSSTSSVHTYTKK